MKKTHAGQLKPVGWSWYSGYTTRNGFFLGMFGGSLKLRDEQFQEWFLRIPFLGLVIVICHVGRVPSLSDDRTSAP